MYGSGQKVTERTVFHQIHVSATVSSLVTVHLLWRGSGRAARHGDVILNPVDFR